MPLYFHQGEGKESESPIVENAFLTQRDQPASLDCMFSIPASHHRNCTPLPHSDDASTGQKGGRGAVDVCVCAIKRKCVHIRRDWCRHVLTCWYE